MSDIPFWSGGSGSGTGGVSNYDQLSNKPVTNISGSGIVISSLSTGVYNIDGTWKITSDDDERETLKDDLFYVKNDGDNVGEYNTGVFIGMEFIQCCFGHGIPARVLNVRRVHGEVAEVVVGFGK